MAPRVEQLAEGVTLYLGDCMEVLPTLPASSIDAVIADLPYGTTANKWDLVIDLPFLWNEYRRVSMRSSPVILTASQPFTSALVMSNPSEFRVEWIWQKNRGSNFATTKYMPMKEHESVLIFQRDRGPYNPIMQQRSSTSHAAIGSRIKASNTGKREGISGLSANNDIILSELRVPSSIQKFNVEVGFHPTQKPTSLMEYLIRTYTNPSDIVLDNTMGSGTTGVAAARLGRRFIGIDSEEKYFDIACKRIDAAARQSNMMFAGALSLPQAQRDPA